MHLWPVPTAVIQLYDGSGIMEVRLIWCWEGTHGAVWHATTVLFFYSLLLGLLSGTLLLNALLWIAGQLAEEISF